MTDGTQMTDGSTDDRPSTDDRRNIDRYERAQMTDDVRRSTEQTDGAYMCTSPGVSIVATWTLVKRSTA